MQRYGFTGLGAMGAPMAANLAAHFDVIGLTRTDKRRDEGPTCQMTFEAGRALIADLDALFLCLPNADAVEEVLFGTAGLARDLRRGAIVVDAGTTDHARTLAIADRLAANGLGFVDAPVSGMRARAEAGTLTIMCGGGAEAIAALRPALQTMAASVLHMGPVGSGQLAKLINQLLFDVNVAALAEILPFAAALGLDPKQIARIVNAGTGRSYASETFLPHILEGEFSTGYPMAAAYKDLVSAAEIAARHTVPLPVLAAATASYQHALRAGHGDKDKGGMIRVFEELLGVAFRADPEVIS